MPSKAADAGATCSTRSPARSGRSGAGSSSTRSVTAGVYKHLRDVPPDEIVREAAKAVGDGEPGKRRQNGRRGVAVPPVPSGGADLVTEILRAAPGSASTPAAPARRAEPRCLREFVIAGNGFPG